MNNAGVADYALFAFAVTLGFAVRGGAGFGGGIVAVPLLALIAPLSTVVPFTSALNTIASVLYGSSNWRKVEWRELARIAPFAVLGAAVGVALLAHVDPRPLSRVFGVFVMVYAAYMLYSSGEMPAIPRRWLTPLAAVLSIAGGAIGSLFGGAAGPVFVMYLNALKIEKDQFRATLTMLMVALGCTRIIGYAIVGMYNTTVLTLLVVGLPLMLLGGYLGNRIVQRFDQRKFNLAVGGIIFISGILLILK
ncbi:MAG: sulfite exporter TauE/SafE family protein [Burkholderiales bacterium]